MSLALHAFQKPAWEARKILDSLSSVIQMSSQLSLLALSAIPRATQAAEQDLLNASDKTTHTL